MITFIYSRLPKGNLLTECSSIAKLNSLSSLLSYLFFRKKTKDCNWVAGTEHPHKKVSDYAENANNFQETNRNRHCKMQYQQLPNLQFEDP
jgi:hypothetical protein